MAFPAAKSISYSTCSVHKEENEYVVLKALTSQVATSRQWRVMRRDEQVEGLKTWHIRGDAKAVTEFLDDHDDAEQSLVANVLTDACIRCEKAGKDGTMGFFVAAFIRDVDPSAQNGGLKHAGAEVSDTGADLEDEWSGFSDS